MSQNSTDAAKMAQDYVRQIAESGGKIDMDPTMKPIRYVVTGKELYRMGMIYYGEGDHRKAFTLFLRFLTLFLEKLPRHPSYSTIDESEKRNINRLMKDVAGKAEEVKRKLIAEYTVVFEARIAEFEKAEAKRRAEEEEEQRRKAAEAQRMAAVAIQQQRMSQQPALPAPVSTPIPKSRPSLADLTAKLPKLDEKPPLRTMIVPSQVAVKFSNCAASNTQQNRETCGVLCGKLIQNEFHITHVVLPKQSGTSDTCDTIDEHEIFTVLEQYDLITLGWIHTHPSQTAFLSSVDLHTHYGYQCLLPEAIAIVCSARYNEVGYFTLTSSHGLPTLAACRQHGFHEHKTSQMLPLFENAAFVRVVDGGNVQFIDLRHSR